MVTFYFFTKKQWLNFPSQKKGWTFLNKEAEDSEMLREEEEETNSATIELAVIIRLY